MWSKTRPLYLFVAINEAAENRPRNMVVRGQLILAKDILQEFS